MTERTRRRLSFDVGQFFMMIEMYRERMVPAFRQFCVIARDYYRRLRPAKVHGVPAISGERNSAAVSTTTAMSPDCGC